MPVTLVVAAADSTGFFHDSVVVSGGTLGLPTDISCLQRTMLSEFSVAANGNLIRLWTKCLV